MLMLGPGDFTVLSGVPGEFAHPTVEAALKQISRAASSAGKNWAATCGTVEQARIAVEMGARLIFHGCDIIFVKQGLEQVREKLAGVLGVTFEQTEGTSYHAAGTRMGHRDDH